MIKVLVADDHQMFIDGIVALINNEKEINVVAEALDGSGVIDCLKENSVDIVLLDINMPGLNGIETLSIVKERFPSVRVIILTMHNKQEYIKDLMHKGAEGYILKNTGKKELLEAIKTVYAGRTYFSKEVTETIMKGLTKSSLQNTVDIQLTAREKEILILIVQELSSKEIAEKLFISTNTVETHRKNLMAKLDAKNLAGLVKYAIQSGLIH